MNRYDETTGKYVNKVLRGDQIEMDITDANIQASDILTNKLGYGASGERLVGTCDYDVNSSAPVSGASPITPSSVLEGTYGYVNAQQVLGTLPNNGTADITFSATETSTEKTIPYGAYQNGSKVTVTDISSAQIVTGNTLFGIEGTGGGGTFQAKTATPTLSQQTITPDEGYAALSMVTINAVPIVEEETATGITVTICPANYHR